MVTYNCMECACICALSHGLSSLSNDRNELCLLSGLQAAFLFQENEKMRIHEIIRKGLEFAWMLFET